MTVKNVVTAANVKKVRVNINNDGTETKTLHVPPDTDIVIINVEEVKETTP